MKNYARGFVEIKQNGVNVISVCFIRSCYDGSQCKHVELAKKSKCLSEKLFIKRESLGNFKG